VNGGLSSASNLNQLEALSNAPTSANGSKMNPQSTGFIMPSRTAT
jgi:hypothetical protein